MIDYPIRIAHIINSLEFGGAEKVLVNIVNNEDRDKYLPYVFSLNNKNPLKEELKNHIPFKSYQKRKIFDFFLVLFLIKEFRKQKIQVTHIHDWGIFPESFCASFIARIPVTILMDHGRVNITGILDEKKSIYIKIKNYIVAQFVKRIDGTAIG